MFILASKWVVRVWLAFTLGAVPIAHADKFTRLTKFTKFSDALSILSESKRGRILVDHSKAKGLLSALRWGESSRTDTTLTRQYNPLTGKEERFRKLVIYLKKEQPLLELALDLAHELVHATSKPIYDPYDPTLTPAKYIQLAIEGLGGEVDAVYTECEIGMQLSKVLGVKLERCKRYLNTGPLPGDIDRTKILRGFYRVGNWRTSLETELGKEIALLPSLSSDRAVLFSSTGHAPYPVALFQEYEEITQAACENSIKRRASIVSSSAAASGSSTWSGAFSSLSPLVTSAPQGHAPGKAYDELETFMSKRCHFTED